MTAQAVEDAARGWGHRAADPRGTQDDGALRRADGERDGQGAASERAEHPGERPGREGGEPAERQEEDPHREGSQPAPGPLARPGPEDLAVGPDATRGRPSPEEHREGVGDREGQEEPLQARGVRTLTRKEFLDEWLGMVVTLEPRSETASGKTL